MLFYKSALSGIPCKVQITPFQKRNCRLREDSERVTRMIRGPEKLSSEGKLKKIGIRLERRPIRGDVTQVYKNNE